MALTIKDKLLRGYQNTVRPIQNVIQQAALANIAYQRERSLGQTRGQQIGRQSITPALNRFSSGINRSPLGQPLKQAANVMRTSAWQQNPINQFGSGIAAGSTFGFTPIQPTAQTRGGKVAYTAGSLLGAFNPYSITGKTIGGITRATNPIVSRAISPVANKLVTGRIAAGLGNVAQGAAINPLYGMKPLQGAGIDFATGVAFGPNQFGKIRGMAKGYDLGTNQKNVKWAPDDAKLLDTLIDRLKQVKVDQKTRSYKNITNQELLNLDKELSFLVQGYLKADEVRKIENTFGGNELGIMKALADKLRKSAKNAPEYTPSTYLPDLQMGIKGNKPPKGVGEIKPQSTVGGVSQTKTQMPKVLPETQTPNPIPAPIKNTLQTNGSLPKQITTQLPPERTALKTKLPISQTAPPKPKTNLALEKIISEGRQSIGTAKEKPGKNVKQSLDDFYTQWVDRYHPLSKASKQAKTYLKGEGATLRPEADPDYLVRRLTGAGAIADQRFKTKLNPILKEFETSGIQKADMDTYLAHNRMLGFDQAGREIYGVDPVKSKQVVQALEQKYPGIQNIAQKFYQYEDEGLQELAKSGFFTQADIQAMRSQNPNYAPLYRVMDKMDDYLGLPTRKTMQGTSPVQRIKGSKRQILSPVESVIGDTFKQRAAIEKNRVAQSIVNLQKVTEMGFEKVSKSGNDTITVWNNGQKEYWRVGQDIADVAKGANEEAMNLLLKIIQAPAQLLRQGATGRNPAFMIPNIVRDQLDAGITSKYGYIPFVDYVSGLKSMLKNDEIYQSWNKSGAKIDLGELSGRKSISKLSGEKTGKRGLFGWLSEGLDVMGKYSEQPTRVGLYKKALKKTGNELLSAMESRDATVDFARMGSKMKVANSIIPFLNVGVQGFDKLIRATKNSPGKVALNLGLYAAAPAAAVTLYNLSNHPDEYAEIPQYDKDDNFIIVRGRNVNGTVDYITIPKGNIVPIAANPIQSFIEYVHNKDSASFKEMALRTLTDVLPVVESGGSLKEIGIKTIGSNLPQAIKPVTENLLNKSFYKYDSNKEESKEIVPYYLKDKPAYKQDYEFTPQMYKKIGAVLNISPLQIKNLMEGYLAGYSKIPAQIVEMLYNSSRGEALSPNDKTILSRFVKQTYPTSGTKPKEQVKSPGLIDRVTGKVGAVESVQALPTNTKDLSVLYKDASRIVNSYAENKVKAQYGLVDKSLEEYQDEVDQAIAMKKRIEKEQPERVFEIQLETYNKDGGASTKERTDWVVGELKKTKNPNNLIKKLYNAQVLTQSVVEELNDKYKLGLTKYNYGEGYRNLPGTKGKKAKKTISDAQILSAYKKALEASYKPRKTAYETAQVNKPIRLKRTQIKRIY